MDTKDYIDLRLEQLKLKSADTASQALGGTLAWFLILGVAILALAALAFGGVLLIGEALGNYALGALIVAGGLLLIAVILFALRKVLFRGTFIKMLSGKGGHRELERAEEMNAVRLEAAESSLSAGIGSLGLRFLRILIRFAARR